VGAWEALESIANATPAGRISSGIEAGDVGDEADPKGDRAIRDGARRWSANRTGAGLYQQQQANDKDQNAGNQVPKRRSP
jgi:hypothetical protein